MLPDSYEISRATGIRVSDSNFAGGPEVILIEGSTILAQTAIGESVAFRHKELFFK